MKSILVSAGEVSGDHYIAGTAAALRRGGFDGAIYGLCGTESKSAGVGEMWGNGLLHLLGISEVIRSVGSVLRLMREMRRHIIDTRPDVVLVVDSPDFHLPLIRSVRRGGYRGKIFYISPPSVWAWRRYRVRDLVRYLDVCFPLFAFEHEYLTGARVDSRWIGHPLAEEFAGLSVSRGSVIKNIKGDPPCEGDVIVALLPGSRRSEVETLYPVLSGLYELLEKDGAKPVFSVAPGLNERTRGFLTHRLEKAGERYYEGRGRDIMGVADVAAGASGTVTAEALLLRRYMVVMYKVKPLSYVIGRLLLRGIKFAIPNLLAGEYFFPELLQKRATPRNAHAEIRRWFDMDSQAREDVAASMEGLIQKMGSPGVYDFWARDIAEAIL